MLQRCVPADSWRHDVACVCLLQLVCSCDPHGVQALAEKMDRAAAEDWTFDILDSQQTGRVSRSHLQAVVQACLQLALGDSTSTSAASRNDHVAAAIAAG